MDEGHLIALLVCQIGRRTCALPADRVGETMRPLPVTPIPDAPSHILGMAVVRGQPTPVLDLCQLLDESARGITRFVTLRPGHGHGSVALAVDEVEGVRRVRPDSLHNMPSLLQGGMPMLVSAVSPQDTELLLLLDSVRLVGALDMAGLDEAFAMDGGQEEGA